LLKVLDDGKLKDVDKVYKHFESIDKASKVVKMKAFSKFKDNKDALEETASMVSSKMSKSLKKFLQKNVVDKGIKDQLAVSDSKLGSLIKEKLGIKCQADEMVMELMRGLRNQMSGLVSGLSNDDLKAMRLGLSHSLSRHRLKFSPEKVDTMIIQAVSLLDDVDKELNIYAMRVREWYGWHFPEMAKIVNDNIKYAKSVLKMGMRPSCTSTDFSDILEDTMEAELKEAAVVSMGTMISEVDLVNIKALCEQVVQMVEYRGELFEYLQNRMRAVAPNLTTMLGELVGARLIAHAGSLMNLAKAPASTVQILGAEKALFRALKTKHETPKYGLIYHASLIGQAQPKHKGKVARVLASKATLSARVDALAPGETPEVGIAHRAFVEQRLRALEGEVRVKSAGSSKAHAPPKAFTPNGSTSAFNDSSDVTLSSKKKKKSKKDKDDEMDVDTPSKSVEAAGSEKKKKKKKDKSGDEDSDLDVSVGSVKSEKKKKKKSKTDDAEETPAKDKKEKKRKREDPDSEKKKKKKKKKD